MSKLIDLLRGHRRREASDGVVALNLVPQFLARVATSSCPERTKCRIKNRNAERKSK
jgi:hypothetical protein